MMTQLHLNELVHYHDQQITSRSLNSRLAIEQPTTLYAFAQAETISNETSEQTKLITILDGCLVIIQETQRITAQTGDLITIPAGTLHGFAAQTDCRFLQIEL